VQRKLRENDGKKKTEAERKPKWGSGVLVVETAIRSCQTRGTIQFAEGRRKRGERIIKEGRGGASGEGEGEHGGRDEQ